MSILVIIEGPNISLFGNPKATVRQNLANHVSYRIGFMAMKRCLIIEWSVSLKRSQDQRRRRHVSSLDSLRSPGDRNGELDRSLRPLTLFLSDADSAFVAVAIRPKTVQVDIPTGTLA